MFLLAAGRDGPQRETVEDREQRRGAVRLGSARDRECLFKLQNAMASVAKATGVQCARLSANSVLRSCMAAFLEANITPSDTVPQRVDVRLSIIDTASLMRVPVLRTDCLLPRSVRLSSLVDFAVGLARARGNTAELSTWAKRRMANMPPIPHNDDKRHRLHLTRPTMVALSQAAGPLVKDGHNQTDASGLLVRVAVALAVDWLL